jgi:multidrug efflux pump subunit AcrA (membrane-fusion protein)
VSQVNCTPDSAAVSNIQGAIAAAEKVVSDTEQVADAENAYAEAQTSLASTQDKDATALAQANQAVAQATQALTQATDAEAADEKDVENQAAETLAAAQVAKSEACPTSASSAACTQATAAYDQASAALSHDSSGLQAAQVLAQATETKDAESLQAAKQAIASAKVALSNTKAENAALAAPAPLTTIETDSDQIKSAEAQVTNLEDEVAQTRLVAPVSGVVAEVNVSPYLPSTVTTAGSPVAAASIGAVVGDIVLEVPSAWTALAEVADTQVSDLRPGEQAVIQVPGLAKAIHGVVSTVQPAAQLTDGVAAYPVQVVLDHPPTSKLHAGTTVTVTIVTRSVHDTLSIPLAALHTIGTKSYVDILEHGRTVHHAVAVGVEGSNRVQIVSGLHSGEPVVLARLDQPLPNGPVKRPGRFLHPPVRHVPAARKVG